MSLDISVVICTHNRADSLRETLNALEACERAGLDVEIVVVDNNSSDMTKTVVSSFEGRLPVRYLFEPIPGKNHCLNRAFDAGGFGEIVAVLDDDMSPEAGWFEGVAAVSARWPSADIFGGQVVPRWPDGFVPAWSRSLLIAGWAYSYVDWGKQDQKLTDGRWPCGNHFWFRSRVLTGRHRHDGSWAAETPFVLDLVERGSTIVASPQVVATHRFQEALLDPSRIRERAKAFGRFCAETKFSPYRRTVKQSRQFGAHPIVGRLFCGLSLCRWRLTRIFAKVGPAGDRRILTEIVATERIAYFSRVLQLVAKVPEYRMFRRR